MLGCAARSSALVLAGSEVMSDPRDKFFAPVATARVTARLVAEQAGILAGAAAVPAALAEIGLAAQHQLADGAALEAGSMVTEIAGSPKEIALAEERLIGLMAKPSGIATATARFVARAQGRVRVVSGAWKKLPFSQKEMIRQAIVVGGAVPRIAEWPFLYIDKNFVRMYGGLEPTLAAARRFDGWTRIVQIRGEYGDIGDEAVRVATGGATIVFVDSGTIGDAERAISALKAQGLRSAVEVAFAGGVQLGDIEALAEIGVDIVDIGRPIVDAPLLDMRLDVIDVLREREA
jgi:nicotinate-nucleotide pyrophosphorylase (carboxylating)